MQSSSFSQILENACAGGPKAEKLFYNPSLTQEWFDVESLILRHFVTWSILNPRNYTDLMHRARVRAEGPLFTSVIIRYQYL